MSVEKISLKLLCNKSANNDDDGVSGGSGGVKGVPSFSKTVLLAMNLKKSPWLLCRCKKTLDHVQAIQKLIRTNDKLKVIVKLEKSKLTKRDKYLMLLSSSSVATVSGPPHERFLIIGVDVSESNDNVTVGLVLPVTKDTDICLDGEGGFYISSDGIVYSFQPVSVQEMWTALQALVKGVCSVRNTHQQPPQQPPQQQQSGGGVGVDRGIDDWVSFYRGVSQSSTLQVVEWLRVEDALSSSQNIHQQISEGSSDHTVLKNLIRRKLQEILVTTDLDNVTSIQVRDKLEEMLKMDLASSLEMSTSQYRQYLDEEMIMVMRQMDNPSQILDFLYLGSEWNASNLEELQKNGVGYILNVTKEIDNFFPGMFKYCNVRVYDYEETELIKHWNSTYKFIDEARRTSSKILVHCKMGVSRSASTVIAYLMKGHQCTLEHAYQMVKQRRSCVQPNPGFMKQLIIYQGILDASNHRHSKIFRSRSISDVDNVEGDVLQRVKSQHARNKSTSKKSHRTEGDRVENSSQSFLACSSSSSLTKTSKMFVKFENVAVKKSVSVPMHAPSSPSSLTPASSHSPKVSTQAASPTSSTSPVSSLPQPPNDTFVVSDIDMNCLTVASTELTPPTCDVTRDDVIIVDESTSFSSSSVLRQWSCLSPAVVTLPDEAADGSSRDAGQSRENSKENATTGIKCKNDNKADYDDDDESPSSPRVKMMRSLSWPCLYDDHLPIHTTERQPPMNVGNTRRKTQLASINDEDVDDCDDAAAAAEEVTANAVDAPQKTTTLDQFAKQFTHRDGNTMRNKSRKGPLKKFHSVCVD